MYLINKDETEHTGQVSLDLCYHSFRTEKNLKKNLSSSGSRLRMSPLKLMLWHSLFQESYVWKMYQERCWDFFPAGDCFRKQYEDQLS